jgi:hypothetical protein
MDRRVSRHSRHHQKGLGARTQREVTDYRPICFQANRRDPVEIVLCARVKPNSEARVTVTIRLFDAGRITAKSQSFQKLLVEKFT